MSRVSPQAFQNCPGPYVVGQTRCDFWVLNDWERGSQTRIDATVRYVSTYAVWFVQDGLSGDDALSSTELQSLAAALDNTIFPKVTGVFGQTADVDGNGKIFIVLSPLVGRANLLGYVTGVDLFREGTFSNRHSNEGDIFYVTTPGPFIGPNLSRSDFLGYIPLGPWPMSSSTSWPWGTVS